MSKRITRRAIYTNEWAYADHVRACTYLGEIKTLELFRDTFPDDPSKVVEMMFDHLRHMNRIKRKDAIRTLLSYQKKEAK